ncbi:MAG: hypothetical protein CSA58_12335 [Micrococcales bacterium]|nr:MAG: hypothetical protein CSB46_09270 [Micrococcales bacterium]PIE25899.1 MAG: hypothetical protein CSA58_12335 [Micrococcales bacterium]
MRQTGQYWSPGVPAAAPPTRSGLDAVAIALIGSVAVVVLVIVLVVSALSWSALAGSRTSQLPDSLGGYPHLTDAESQETERLLAEKAKQLSGQPRSPEVRVYGDSGTRIHVLAINAGHAAGEDTHDVWRRTGVDPANTTTIDGVTCNLNRQASWLCSRISTTKTITLSTRSSAEPLPHQTVVNMVNEAWEAY